MEEAFAHCYCTFNNLKLWYVLQLQGNVHHLLIDHEEFGMFLRAFAILLYLFSGIRYLEDFLPRKQLQSYLWIYFIYVHWKADVCMHIYADA